MLDSSIWIAYLNENDTCHKKALDILLKCGHLEIVIYDHVYSEVLNVLRNKTTEEICRTFVQFLEDYPLEITISDEHILSLANTYFFKYPKLSFSDCMIMAASILSYSQLVTFDKSLQKAWEEISAE